MEPKSLLKFPAKLSLGCWLLLVVTTSGYATTCLQLKQQLQRTFNIPFILSYNFRSCSLVGWGDGRVFEQHNNNFNTLVAKTHEFFEDRGWHKNRLTRSLAADAPYGSYFAYVKHDRLMMVSVKLVADLAYCQKDRPLDLYHGCQLTPKQRQYTIKLTRYQVFVEKVDE